MILARQDNRNFYIKNNKFYVEKTSYTSENLLEFENQNKVLVNGAPATRLIGRKEIFCGSEDSDTTTTTKPRAVTEKTDILLLQNHRFC